MRHFSPRFYQLLHQIAVESTSLISTNNFKCVLAQPTPQPSQPSPLLILMVKVWNTFRLALRIVQNNLHKLVATQSLIMKENQEHQLILG